MQNQILNNPYKSKGDDVGPITIPSPKIEYNMTIDFGNYTKKELTRLLRSYTLEFMTTGYQLITATYKNYNMIEDVADNQLLLYDLSSDYVELIFIDEIKTFKILTD